MADVIFKDVKAAFDLLGPEKVTRAQLRAVNKAAKEGRSKASKEIRKTWNLPAKKVDNLLTVLYGQGGIRRTKAALVAASESFSMTDFVNKNRAVNFRNGKITYSIERSDGGKVYSHGFWATLDSGHVGLFRRGKKKPGGRKQNRKRLSNPDRFVYPELHIVEPRVITIASMLEQGRTLDNVMEDVGLTMEHEFWRNLNL